MLFVLTNCANFPYSIVMGIRPQFARTAAAEQDAASRLPWNGIILDLALFAWAGILGFAAPWIRTHLGRIFNWVWLLHTLTFCSVMLGFVLTAPPKLRIRDHDRLDLFRMVPADPDGSHPPVSTEEYC